MTIEVPQIGLTGSIGSGKSAVAKLFGSWGSAIVDADIIAKKLLDPGTFATEALISKFGAEICRPDGSLDRFALRAIVFSDANVKKELEALLHPEIRKQLLAQSQSLIEVGALSVTLVIPLLFESPCPYSNLTHTVVVSSFKKLCVERASKRDACSPQIIEKIFDAQISCADREKQADYIIKNNGTLEQLKEQSLLVFNQIHSLKSSIDSK